MRPTFFCDGIAEINVINGALRIEFFVLSPIRDSKSNSSGAGGLERKSVLSVGMPLAGFAGSLEVIEDLKRKLIAGGVFQARPEGSGSGSAVAKSPNFD